LKVAFRRLVSTGAHVALRDGAALPCLPTRVTNPELPSTGATDGAAAEALPPAPAIPGGPSIEEAVAVERADEQERRARRFNLGGRTLRQHAARGTVINGLFTIATSGLGLVKGFILAGFLTQQDYGIWGILIVALGTLVWLKQVGIGDKYIQQDDEDQEAAFQKAFTLELIFTGAMTLVIAALLPAVAALYNQPRIIVPGLVALLILPAGILQAPLWVYYRRMDFVRQRALQAVDPIVGFVASVALAIAGAGYWALVGGVVAGAWAAAIAAVFASPFKLRLRYDRGTLRSYFGFSWPLFMATFGGLVIAQTSMLTSNDALGLAGAGVLTLAVTISQFTDRVDGLITGTLYPAICAVRDRRELLHESFVKSNRIALMWAMPFGFGLALFAADLIHFGIGDRWHSALILLQVNGVVAAVGHLGFNWDAYFRAIGETKPMAIAATASGITFVACVPLIYSEGVTGLGIGIAAQMLANLAVRAYFLTRLFAGFALARHAARAIWPTVPAVGAVLLMRLAEPGHRTLSIALGEVAVYVLVTLAATWRYEKPLLAEAVSYLRRRPAAAV
jgi:PST family polysaccharide transporter